MLAAFDPARLHAEALQVLGGRYRVLDSRWWRLDPETDLWSRDRARSLLLLDLHALIGALDMSCPSQYVQDQAIARLRVPLYAYDGLPGREVPVVQDSGRL